MDFLDCIDYDPKISRYYKCNFVVIDKFCNFGWAVPSKKLEKSHEKILISLKKFIEFNRNR